MEDIRVLSNIELHDRKLINIFFVGQQEFNSILMTPQNRALAQRITVRYNIEPLDKTETGAYINHRIQIAGGDYNIFKKKAVDEIHQFSTGIPRLINIICDHALLTGYARGAKTIDEIVVKECAKELRIPIPAMPLPHEGSRNSGISGAVTAQQSIAESDKKPQNKKNHENTRATDRVNETNPSSGRSMVWKLAYAGMVLLLFAIVGFAIDHFTGNDKPRWSADDLTPNKYKTSLEKEKEQFFNILQGGDDQLSQPDQTATERDVNSTERGPGNNPSSNQAEPAGTGKIETSQTAASNNALPMLSSSSGEIEPLPLIKDKIIINFNINSNEIDDKSYTVLDSVASFMMRHPNEIIHVRGFTDTSGTSSYNESVSRFRASAVKSYLIGKGVLADNIIVFAMGSVDPIASNQSLDGRRKNRRVEIEFAKSTGE
jgi:general secretion pathway protein A